MKRNPKGIKQKRELIKVIYKVRCFGHLVSHNTLIINNVEVERLRKRRKRTSTVQIPEQCGDDDEEKEEKRKRIIIGYTSYLME